MSEKYIKRSDLDDTILRLNKEGWEITRGEYKRIDSVLFEMPNYAEPCEDCVSRKAILNEFRRCDEELTSITPRFVRELPPVQPKEKVGEWIITEEDKIVHHRRIWHCHCSECKTDAQDCVGGSEDWWLVRLPNYCPNCGAKMKGEKL